MPASALCFKSIVQYNFELTFKKVTMCVVHEEKSIVLKSKFIPSCRSLFSGVLFILFVPSQLQ